MKNYASNGHWFILLSILVLSSCGQNRPSGQDKSSQTKLEITWPLGLRHSDFVSAQVRILNADTGQPMLFEIREFHPTMPSMGHGTYEDEQTYHPLESDPFTIVVERIFLSMPGLWRFEVVVEMEGQEMRVVKDVEIN